MRVLLVDGTNVVMRYAFAMLPDVVADRDRKATDQDIEKVMSAVERALRDCARDTGCTHAVIALDSVGELWRKAIYPEYKRGRNTITGPWVNMLSTWLSSRGWYTARMPGQEADDVIATLRERLVSKNHECIVLSGDSDLLALTGDLCMVYQFGRDGERRFVARPPAFVEKKFGVQPEALRLYKALVGEGGDGIPGVRGCGPKKADKLLKMANYNHETLRGLLPVFSATALQEFDQMLALVTLNTKVPLDPISPAQCAIPEVAP